MRFRPAHSLIAAALLLALAPAFAREPTQLVRPAHGVVGVEDAQLDPNFWIGKLGADADRVLLDKAAIDAANAAMRAQDPTIHDLGALPASITAQQAREWIEEMSERPTRTLYDEKHQVVPAATLDGLVDALALDKLAASTPTRYALVVERASLRTFPTNLRVFSSDDDTDIDRFQESALFPGTPVAIVHESRDGQWAFIVSQRYRAWVETKHLAQGARDVVLGFPQRTPFRVVTGAKVSTVHTPELPQASELSLDMSTRLPIANVAPDKIVNGQHPYSSWTVDLPVREANGTLRIAPALLQKNSDTQGDYLPLTHANILRQAFKFLGERYGWGHDYNARDCSGFVSDVYATMGILMPRNTRDQSRSPSLHKTLFDDKSTREQREATIKDLQTGDLVYIPGHVMMVIGWIGDQPYVIHDTNGGTMRAADGKLRSLHLNGVSVTPLLPLMYDETHRYVDRMTSVVRVATSH
ncbi:SH3 domain-containing protein [Noviluteimonas gilva]|uniref:NlpC-P60 family protein n=1 Tax=Noviluteimonas gilva TaxID=2682097 RepID=A0A7C9M581_9GAMM|nr:SH3 domain-containing protein [Lysobacter gilvus]MUV15222.1 NlpC-P60 family protein [Lysobacter gilvus]